MRRSAPIAVPRLTVVAVTALVAAMLMIASCTLTSVRAEDEGPRRGSLAADRRAAEIDPDVHGPGDGAGGYPLDAVPREVPPTGRLRCDTSALTSYRGTSLRLQAPVRVHIAFVPYIQRFEDLAREVATTVYGRPPRSMAHAGAYNCRRIRGADSVLSEHALGNAIDVRGFDFGSASRTQPLPTGVMGRFQSSFRVRVEDHWVAHNARYTVHERFFAALRARLEADPDLFTVMLGPSYPGHRNHLHFDRSPFRFVQF